MKPTQALHEAGQSLWLDNITRALLDERILARYVAEYSVTGLTSNPTIFDLALADLRRAADLLAPVHARTDGVDGWVSLEVSPLLAHDTPRTADQAESLHREAAHWARLANEGARAQRLLWASTSVKDPRARDVLYVEALAAPFTVNTMPDQTLEAFAASWQDLLARIGTRHEQLARPS